MIGSVAGESVSTLRPLTTATATCISLPRQPPPAKGYRSSSLGKQKQFTRQTEAVHSANRRVRIKQERARSHQGKHQHARARCPPWPVNRLRSEPCAGARDCRRFVIKLPTTRPLYSHFLRALYFTPMLRGDMPGVSVTEAGQFALLSSNQRPTWCSMALRWRDGFPSY